MPAQDMKDLFGIKIGCILLRDRTIGGQIASIEKTTQADDHEVGVVGFHGSQQQLDGIRDERDLKIRGDILDKVKAGGTIIHENAVAILDEDAADLQMASFSLNLWISRTPTGNSGVVEEMSLSKTHPRESV